MSDQIIRALFRAALLFLFGEHPDRVPYDFRFGLPSLSRQPPDQRLSLCVQPNTQRHVTPSRNVIHDCTTATVVCSMAAHWFNSAARSNGSSRLISPDLVRGPFKSASE